LESRHYAAILRQEGGRYLLEDPTFGNTVWATKQALEAETSGYFLIPPGVLPQGWRSVEEKRRLDSQRVSLCPKHFLLEPDRLHAQLRQLLEGETLSLVAHGKSKRHGGHSREHQKCPGGARLA